MDLGKREDARGEEQERRKEIVIIQNLRHIKAYHGNMLFMPSANSK
jgi:hypothetical protein